MAKNADARGGGNTGEAVSALSEALGTASIRRIGEAMITGEPIPEDRKEALFGKFELVGRIEHHQKGTGLSLPIAGAAMETHGGRIFVESIEGNCTCAMRVGDCFYMRGGKLALVLRRSGEPVGKTGPPGIGCVADIAHRLGRARHRLALGEVGHRVGAADGQAVPGEDALLGGGAE